MPIEPVETIWVNGELVAWEDAKIHVLSHALHYGTGVFEGIRAYETERGPAVFRLTDHLERMRTSARIFLMELPYTTAQLRDAVHELIRANRLRSCYIRPLAFRGFGGEMGVNPERNPIDVVIAVWRWGRYLGDDALRRGIRATISSWRRQDPNIIPPSAKATGAYVNASMAKLEAVHAGYDEAIMLNPAGFVAEASGENVFIVRDGVLLTPPLAAGPLPGITRASIIDIAGDEGIPVAERDLTRADLYTAEEMFLVGTAAEVTPVREVDERVIGDPGPVTLALQQRFFDIVQGRDGKFSEWLDVVA